MVSRSANKVEPVMASIRDLDSNVKATFVEADLADLDSVRRAAVEILELAPRVDVLINSAGNMAIKDYTLDKQGLEMQLSVNHVGHFLLTNLLVPALLQAATAANATNTALPRVVNLTSGAYLISPVRFEDYNFSNGEAYQHWIAYGQAKTANILFSFGLSKRLQRYSITSSAAHPGYNGDTQLARHLTWDDIGDIEPIAKANTGKDFVWEEPRLKTFEQIAATPLVAALDPAVAARSPVYLQNGQVTEVDESARSPDNVEKLWKLSEKLVGQVFDY
ncbi:short-chain dehydrogenase [Apiospora hydei]|uniref:Short-chain dehydrogenase n=1 Tax=Apiospora hydei TaxID=1337664 RepID=A0ABR1WBH3_9PEZI